MGVIYGNGVTQEDLVDLLVLIKTNFNAILAKLDLDGGVADVNYASLYALAYPAGFSATFPKGIADQGVVVSFINSIVTNFNLVLAKLDLDGTVNSTNYAATTAMTNPVGVTIFSNGLGQGEMAHVLNHIIAKIAALNAKLDVDTGVVGTNYASLWNVTDTVDESGTQA